MTSKLVTIDLDALNSLDDELLKFGDYPVEMSTNHRFGSDGISIECKGVTGTLDQLEDWLFNHVRDPYKAYYFGYGDQQSEIVRDGQLVKIACLQEDYVGFKIKLNKLIHGVNRSKNRK